MAQQDIRTIGIFIDGGYYAKVDAALKKVYSRSLNLRGLLDYITDCICKMDGLRKEWGVVYPMDR